MAGSLNLPGDAPNARGGGSAPPPLAASRRSGERGSEHDDVTAGRCVGQLVALAVGVQAGAEQPACSSLMIAASLLQQPAAAVGSVVAPAASA
jgi:hypothetical protein